MTCSQLLEFLEAPHRHQGQSVTRLGSNEKCRWYRCDKWMNFVEIYDFDKLYLGEFEDDPIVIVWGVS